MENGKKSLVIKAIYGDIHNKKRGNTDISPYFYGIGWILFFTWYQPISLEFLYKSTLSDGT